MKTLTNFLKFGFVNFIVTLVLYCLFSFLLMGERVIWTKDYIMEIID